MWAHHNLGIALRANGQLDEATQAYREAIKVQPDFAPPYYSLACLHAAVGRKDQALDWLRRAAKAGYSNTAHMKTDPDMDNLRDDPRYAKIIAEMGSNRTQ